LQHRGLKWRGMREASSTTGYWAWADLTTGPIII
jgi:hypothetical protein